MEGIRSGVQRQPFGVTEQRAWEVVDAFLDNKLSKY